MAKDKLLDWLEDAGCNHYQCTYGVDIECEDCIKRMVAEHDAEIRRKVIGDLLEKSQNWKDNRGSFVDFQRLLREQMKGETK